MADQTIYEMKKTASANHTWELKNWKESHFLVTSKASCVVEVDNMKFRFFLRPYKQQLKQGNKMYTNKWYSLLAEMISGHEPAYIRIATEVFFNLGDRESFFKTDEQVVFDTATRDAKDAKVIEKEFIRMEGWCTTADGYGIWDYPFEYGHNLDRYKHTSSHVRIELMVSSFIFELPKEATSSRDNYANVEVEKLPDRFSSLLDNEINEHLSDVRFKLKDNQTLFAHRAILASGSLVFKTMFTSDMRETQTRIVEVPDIGSKTMQVIFEYIYSGRVEYSSFKDNIEDVVYAANKYELPGLLDYCERNLMTFCQPSNAVALLRLAKLHNLSNAIDKLTEYLEKNSAKILLEMV